MRQQKAENDIRHRCKHSGQPHQLKVSKQGFHANQSVSGFTAASPGLIELSPTARKTLSFENCDLRFFRNRVGPLFQLLILAFEFGCGCLHRAFVKRT